MLRFDRFSSQVAGCPSIAPIPLRDDEAREEEVEGGRGRESDDAWQTWLGGEKWMGKENNTLQNTDNLSGFHHRFSAADWTRTNGGEHLHAHRRLMALMFTSAITDSYGTGMDE